MPLLGEEPWDLVVLAEDLDPNASVFKVRFTNEIFTDYEEYLKRINLYRKRIWTCKMTGKSGLTYEEALLSEGKGKEGAVQITKGVDCSCIAVGSIHKVDDSNLRHPDANRIEASHIPTTRSSLQTPPQRSSADHEIPAMEPPSVLAFGQEGVPLHTYRRRAKD